MILLMKQLLVEWNTNKNQRTKLQQAYLILATMALILTGLLSLIGTTYTHAVASIAGILLVVFLVNGIMWAVLDAFITPRLPAQKAANPVRRKK